MPISPGFFLILKVQGKVFAISDFKPRIREVFAGMQIESEGTLTFYFHLPLDVTVSLAGEYNAEIQAVFVELKVEAKQTAYGIRNGVPELFQIAYTINI